MEHRRCFIPCVFVFLFLGCAARTITSDELVAMQRRDAGMKLYKSWWYVGSDDRYHYFVRGDADHPTHRVPVTELSAINTFEFNRHPLARALVAEHFPQFYPWLNRRGPSLVDDAWIDALRLLPPDAPFSCDLSPTMTE